MVFAIKKLPDHLQEIFIWFVMGFPKIFLIVFFSFPVARQLVISLEARSSEMKLDKYEEEVLAAFESEALLPIATKE